jgi:pimeloyl-ACP methyl ester carboxylesterase
VLFHGLGHRRQAFEAVRDQLARQRELIIADLPGHGQSPPLRTDHGSAVQALIDDVTGFLDELGLAKPHIAGCSLGGRIALELAARGRAATVTAISPAGFWTRHLELRYIQAVFWAMHTGGTILRPLGPALARRTAGRALLYALMVNRPSQVSPEQALGDMIGFVAAKSAMRAILIEASPFTASVPSQVPVTIGWGTRDRLLPPRQARVAAARLPHARIVLLPGCGHTPMTDDPQLVADVLLSGSAAPGGARLVHVIEGDASPNGRVDLLRERRDEVTGQLSLPFDGT